MDLWVVLMGLGVMLMGSCVNGNSVNMSAEE